MIVLDGIAPVSPVIPKHEYTQKRVEDDHLGSHGVRAGDRQGKDGLETTGAAVSVSVARRWMMMDPTVCDVS